MGRNMDSNENQTVEPTPDQAPPVSENGQAKERPSVPPRYAGDRKKEYQNEHDYGLPDGVKIFLQENKIPAGAPFQCYVYREEEPRPGQHKTRRVFCFKWENEVPEEPDIQAACPAGGTFLRVLHWYSPSGKKLGLETDKLYIDELEPEGQVAPQLGQPVSPAGGTPPAGSTFEEQLEQFGKLKALFEPKQMTPDQAGQFVERVQEAAMNGAVQTVQKVMAMGDHLVDRVFGKTLDKIDPQPEEPEAPADNGYPAWLQDLLVQYKPLIEKWGERLTSGGAKGEATREMLLEETEFQEVWKDPDKRVQVFDAIAKEVGGGFAQTLFKLLLKQTGEVK